MLFVAGAVLAAAPGTQKPAPGITSARPSLDGAMAAAVLDGKPVLIDLASRKVVRELPLPDGGSPPRDIAFTPDGRRVLAATSDRILVWDARTGRQEGSVGPLEGLVPSLPLHGPGKDEFLLRFTTSGRTGRFVDAGRPDIGLKSWSLRTEGLKPVPARLGGEPSAVSPDGKSVVFVEPTLVPSMIPESPWTTGDDFWLTTRSLTTGETTSRIKIAIPAPGRYAFSPDGGRLAVMGGGERPFIRVIDASTARALRELSGDKGRASMTALEFSPDGRTLAGQWDQMVRAWDVETGRGVGSAVLPRNSTPGYSMRGLLPGGKSILASDGPGLFLCGIGVKGRGVRPIIDRHASPVLALRFSGDGALLASASWDTVKLWDGRTGEPLAPLPLPSDAQWPTPAALAFSPDGSRLAALDQGPPSSPSVYNPREWRVILWDPRSRKLIASVKTFTDSSGTPPLLGFSGDGALVYTLGGDRAIGLWDAKTGDAVRELKLAPTNNYGPPSLAVSPRLDTAVDDSSTDLRILDLNQGVEKKRRWSWFFQPLACGEEALWESRLRQEGTVELAGSVFGPDGTSVFSAFNSEDAEQGPAVWRWSPESGRILMAVRIPARFVLEPVVAASGRHFAAVGISRRCGSHRSQAQPCRDGRPDGHSVASVFDTGTGRTVLERTDIDDPLSTYALHPSEPRMALGLASGEVRMIGPGPAPSAPAGKPAPVRTPEAVTPATAPSWCRKSVAALFESISNVQETSKGLVFSGRGTILGQDPRARIAKSLNFLGQVRLTVPFPTKPQPRSGQDEYAGRSKSGDGIELAMRAFGLQGCGKLARTAAGKKEVVRFSFGGMERYPVEAFKVRDGAASLVVGGIGDDPLTCSVRCRVASRDKRTVKASLCYQPSGFRAYQCFFGKGNAEPQSEARGMTKNAVDAMRADFHDKVYVTGFSGPDEEPGLASARAESVKRLLTMEHGVAASAITTRTKVADRGGYWARISFEPEP
ncbi:MAG: hypothetical protein HY928_03130 [Elusimicrobia bacterium]|nr:hypothetical protein [Elusimicrobiota bacterium]